MGEGCDYKAMALRILGSAVSVLFLNCGGGYINLNVLAFIELVLKKANF